MEKVTIKIKEEQMKAFIEAAKPLIKYLNEYGNPHQTVIVTQTNAELLSGEFTTGEFLEYVKD